MKSRRNFLKTAALFGSGFLGLKSYANANNKFTRVNNLYGELVADQLNYLKLPKGFSYKIISKVGEKMSDGLLVPGRPDGMAAFELTKDKTIIIRNHEISFNDLPNSPFGANYELLSNISESNLYDFGKGKLPALGGTTTLVYNHKTQEVETEFSSLLGTSRNCAGGPTPWNTWLTCEEDVTTPFGNIEKEHGYVFEVPATSSPAIAPPKPIKAMGRFNHEAVAVDPNTCIVYLTEDRSDGLIYRFIPKDHSDLHKGGKLQALKIKGSEVGVDTRNWSMFGKRDFEIGQEIEVEWVDIDNVESPEDDLRFQGFHQKKAAKFARGEGMWYGNDAIYFACTNGGSNKTGQVWKYVPSKFEGRKKENTVPGKLTLFAEPNDSNIVNNCDNLTIAPWGDVILAEDNEHPFLVGIRPDGAFYKIAENIGFASEFAGVCFAPNHNTLFVNIQHAGLTLAIDGPWKV